MTSISYLTALLLALLPSLASSQSVLNLLGFDAFGYELVAAGDIELQDVATDITGIETLFNGDAVMVFVGGLEWQELESIGAIRNASSMIYYETLVGDTVQSTGEFNLLEFGRQLPSFLEVGTVQVDSSGQHEIVVRLFSTGNSTIGTLDLETSRTFMSYPAGVSIIPLMVVLFLAMTTQMVEFSLFFTIFVGACMVTGNIKDGFKTTLDKYILENLADIDHGYVYLFSLFLSGLVSMLQKGGGMLGFTRWVSQFAKTPRAAQVSVFCVTLLCFFDDYTNLLLTGQSMSALSDLLMVSKEKFTFLVDATAAPLASLTPVSSWVGFEVNLIQTEINKLVEIYGEENLTISTSSINVFLESIKYRYYPIFMLILIPALILLQRDFGPMLMAERKVRVYQQTDGGEGRIGGKEGDSGEDGNEMEEIKDENAPRKDIPYKTHNMLIPVLMLIFFIFFLMLRTGNDGSGDQSFTDLIENSDSFSALLWATMATSIITSLMYSVQIVQDGHYVIPTLPVLKSCLFDKEGTVVKDTSEDAPLVGDNDLAAKEQAAPMTGGKVRSLVSFFECVEAFLFGMGRLFPALIVLTLAWATGTIMTTVGADRFFSQVITAGIAPEAMPTIAFIIAVVMALATGSSWSTMTILFPLLMVPTYRVSDGDPLIFYSTVAGVLSGSVAGDHMSPISDTTVISAMSCGCKLLNHVYTQAPYSLLIVLFCILFGTLPVGRNAYPNIVGILLGAVAVVGTVFLVGAPIESPTGRYDFITELFQKCRKNPVLEEFRQETIKFYATGALSEEEEDIKKDGDSEDATNLKEEVNAVEDNDDESEEPKEETVDVKASVLTHVSA